MCLSPLYKRPNNDTEDRRFVPCGRCVECVRKKKKDWEIRLTYALNWSDCSFFKLLTYDEEHLPANFTREIAYDHIQHFIKRLRIELYRKFSKDIKLKYFIASELGEEKNRPHYHCCFYVKGAKFTWAEFNEICKLVWPYGYIGNCYRLDSSRCRYACKYIQKQYNYKFFSRFKLSELFSVKDCVNLCDNVVKAYDIARYNVPEIHFIDEINKLLSIPLNGRLVRMPHYWLKLIENFLISRFWVYCTHDTQVTRTINMYMQDCNDIVPEINCITSYRKRMRRQCLAENKELTDIKPVNHLSNFLNNKDLCQFSIPV